MSTASRTRLALVLLEREIVALRSLATLLLHLLAVLKATKAVTSREGA